MRAFFVVLVQDRGISWGDLWMVARVRRHCEGEGSMMALAAYNRERNQGNMLVVSHFQATVTRVLGDMPQPQQEVSAINSVNCP